MLFYVYMECIMYQSSASISQSVTIQACHILQSHIAPRIQPALLENTILDIYSHGGNGSNTSVRYEWVPPLSISLYTFWSAVDAAPERQSGRKAQISNITAAKVCLRIPYQPWVLHEYISIFQTVADVIRTCLGPKAMLKMILDPMGGILWVSSCWIVTTRFLICHPDWQTMVMRYSAR